MDNETNFNNGGYWTQGTQGKLGTCDTRDTWDTRDTGKLQTLGTSWAIMEHFRRSHHNNGSVQTSLVVIVTLDTIFAEENDEKELFIFS